MFADLEFGGFAIAHNGNLTNAVGIRASWCVADVSLSRQPIRDVIHLMATGSGSVVDRIVNALRQVDGAYSIVALAENCVIGCRDPHGVRPLVLGRLGSYAGLKLRFRYHRCGVRRISNLANFRPGQRWRAQSQAISAGTSGSVFSIHLFLSARQRDRGLSVYQARKQIGPNLRRGHRGSRCPSA